MSDVTKILSAIQDGDELASQQLLPMVYDELRRLAAAKMAQERPGQTLQPTALVHEAYLRLVDSDHVQSWDSRGHFFAAAAEAMRRVLVDNARRKGSHKRGGDRERVDLVEPMTTKSGNSIDLLDLDAALGELEAKHPEKAQIIKLRFFAGFSLEETAEILGVSRATAQRGWAYARAWLFGKLNG